MQESPDAGHWDASSGNASSREARARSISSFSTEEVPRISSGSRELDRVLGGGLVPASVTLLGGEPGVGKSTLLLQLAQEVARASSVVLYASAEESPAQLRLRAERISCCDERLLVLGVTDIDAVCREAQRVEARLLVLDSIQTFACPQSEGVPGSPSQIRACTLKLLELSKSLNLATILVGHVTKEGEIAGPKLLEHMVDTVLSFEGDPQRVYRFLRAVKNRFGAVSELGVFLMEQGGIEDVLNPSALFIHPKSLEHSGSCLCPVVVGTRSYVVEVQALVSENEYSYGRRIAQGYELSRLNLILSVMEKRLELHFGHYDVCINVTGGLQVKEPALDLAIALAIWSSCKDEVIPPKTAWCGELGLSGEIRAVHHLQKRAEELKRVGCTKLIIPAAGKGELSLSIEGVELFEYGDLIELLDDFDHRN